MKSFCVRLPLSILLALAVAFLVGCKDQRQQASTPAPVDPAASFEQVVKNLRHYLDQLHTEPTASFENGAFTSMSHSREVTAHKLIRPADEKENFRGQIDVTTKWSYSYQPSIEAEPLDSSDNVQAAKRKDADASAEEFATSGIEVLDPELISEAGQGSGRGANPLLAGAMDTSQSEERIRKFQFVFQNNRWEFVEETVTTPPEKPDPQVLEEQAPPALDGPDTVLDAVKRALRVQ